MILVLPRDIDSDRGWAISVGVDIVSFKQPVPENIKCHYCDSAATTRDHIVPETLLGRNAWWNLVPACLSCNNIRGRAVVCDCEWCERARILYEMGLKKQSSRYHNKRDNKRERRLSG